MVGRTKFFRILPEMRASTACLLSGTTRNNMLSGKTVVMIPSISIGCPALRRKNMPPRSVRTVPALGFTPNLRATVQPKWVLAMALRRV